MSLHGSIFVVGNASGVGKSTVSAALCRSLARRGSRVAPFKAQNMSNHAAVTPDGGEIGRAQAMQARAAGVEIERRMNPVLLKPSAGMTSHVVLMGDEIGRAEASDFGSWAAKARPIVLDAFRSLRRDHDVVVAEGAGGAAEINLLDRDVVNLPLAAATASKAILVVDIDRGGAFASAFGTVELLPPRLRDTIGGVVFNGFRGERSLLSDGITQIEDRLGIPVLGVLPHLASGPLLGAEDSLDVGAHQSASGGSAASLSVAAIMLPHLANPSDLDPLVAEPDVTVTWTRDPAVVAAADLVVLPGSRATVADLDWVRSTGMDSALREAAGLVVGLCAGYQMLGEGIDDRVESRRGVVAGLGLLECTTTFCEPKIVTRSVASCEGLEISGYQIRSGRPQRAPHADAWFRVEGEPEGTRSRDGRVLGTSLHGLFDNDRFRRAFLAQVAAARGKQFEPADTGFAAALDRQHEDLADWLDAHVDGASVASLIARAPAPEELPGW